MPVNESKFKTIVLWIPRKIIFLILWPFRKTFEIIMNGLKKLFFALSFWVGKKLATFAKWTAKTFKTVMLWSSGDTSQSGFVNLLISFRPLLLLLLIGYSSSFYLTSGGFAGQLVFLLSMIFTIVIAMFFFYSNPIGSTFIPQLYYNMRSIFVFALLGYIGYLLIANHSNIADAISFNNVVNLIAILMVGVFPFVLGQYCSYVWRRYGTYLTKEQQEALKSIVISSPKDIINAQKTIKSMETIEQAFDEIPEKIEAERKKSSLTAGQKFWLLTEIIILRGFRFFRRRKEKKPSKK